MAMIACSCGKRIPVSPEWAGHRIRCAGCGATHDASAALAQGTAVAPVPAAPAEGALPKATMRNCPFCYENIQAEAIKCRFCGESVVAPKQEPTVVPASPSRPETRTDEGGTAVLVVGVLGWVICGLLHPVAWVMGASHESKCRAQGIEPSGAAKAGKILGIIGTILMGIGLTIGILFVIAGAASR